MKFPVAFILGPTGVGKSSIALEAAQLFGAAILSCDSVQCYRGLDIGSAKPTREEQLQVPHFMIDVVNVDAKLTAAEFRRQGLAILERETKKRPVFLVGGSGFYIRALERGVYPIQQIAPSIREKWRAIFSAEGAEFIHQELERQDPEAARKINKADSYRTLRALEVIESERRLWSDIQRQFASEATRWPYRSLKLGMELPRSELSKQIEKRASQMLASGLKAEVMDLLAKGFRNAPALRSVGYRETVQALEEGWDDKKLVDAMTTSTLKLAKKQMTWFRGDPSIVWYSAHEKPKILADLAKWFVG